MTDDYFDDITDTDEDDADLYEGLPGFLQPWMLHDDQCPNRNPQTHEIVIHNTRIRTAIGAIALTLLCIGIAITCCVISNSFDGMHLRGRNLLIFILISCSTCPIVGIMLSRMTHPSRCHHSRQQLKKLERHTYDCPWCGAPLYT